MNILNQILKETYLTRSEEFLRIIYEEIRKTPDRSDMRRVWFGEVFKVIQDNINDKIAKAHAYHRVDL